MGEPSLYERLGGVYAISAVVDSFSDQLVEKGTIEEQNSNIKSGLTVYQAAAAYQLVRM